MTKLLLNQYKIKNYCKNFKWKSKEKELNERDCFNVIHNWIKRNFKGYEKNVKINGIKKKNIKHYRLDLIIDLMFHKARKHKTGEIPIAKFMRYFVDNIKKYELNKLNTIIDNINSNKDNSKELKNYKKLKMQLEQFPKPKIYKDYYKSWYLLWQEIKYLKKLKRLGSLKDIKKLNRLKEDKKILGQFISYKETKSKNLENYYNQYKDIIDYYKIKDKDFKPRKIEDFYLFS